MYLYIYIYVRGALYIVQSEIGLDVCVKYSHII